MNIDNVKTNNFIKHIKNHIKLQEKYINEVENYFNLDKKMTTTLCFTNYDINYISYRFFEDLKIEDEDNFDFNLYKNDMDKVEKDIQKYFEQNDFLQSSSFTER